MTAALMRRSMQSTRAVLASSRWGIASISSTLTSRVKGVLRNLKASCTGLLLVFESAVGIDDGGMVSLEGESGGGLDGGDFVLVSGAPPTSVTSVAGEVDWVQPHEALCVRHAQLTGEHLPVDEHSLVAQSAWRFVQAAFVLDDVILGDAALLGHHEARLELLLVFGKTQLSAVRLPATAGRLLVERLVGTVVVATQIVLQSQLERVWIRIDLDGSVETAQHGGDAGLVEALDLTVPFRIGLGAEDQGPLELPHHPVGVVGDEAWAVVEKQGVHQAVTLHRLEQPAQEELGALASADHRVQGEARAVVEEVQDHPPQPIHASAEVLAVAQHHLHPMRVGEATGVPFVLGWAPASWQAHAHQGTPDRAAVDSLESSQRAALAGPLEQLGHRG